MGWGSGSFLMDSVIESVMTHVSNSSERVSLFKSLIVDFENMDWDTIDDCVGMNKDFDEALKQLYPDYFGDEEEE